jgi:diaminopimelate epimerase
MVPAGEFCLLTDAGMVRVRSPASGDEAEINLPDFAAPEDFSAVPRAAGERWMALVTVGVPHLVIRVEDIDAVDVLGRGRPLRFDPAVGSAGANVNFVSPSPRADGLWLIRTYERGVEAETLACGTGTVAAAVALACRGEGRLPLRFRSRGGPELAVQAELNGAQARSVWLGGQGSLIFRGVWEGV